MVYKCVCPFFTVGRAVQAMEGVYISGHEREVQGGDIHADLPQ